MDLVSIRPISELEELTDEFVYLFVAGPGSGEAIGVHLPLDGWLLVDSCLVGAEIAGKALLRRWPDPLLGCVLTHPHEDHALGFAELLEKEKPEMVVAALPEDVEFGVKAEAKAARGKPTVALPFPKRVAHRNALQAFMTWQDDNEKTLTRGVAGQQLPTKGEATVAVCAPLEARVRDVFEDDTKVQQLMRYANGLSIVLEITFGDTRVVLGGDLVKKEWPAVVELNPQLKEHRGLKVAHHGSYGDLNAGLMGKATKRRVWAVTPYNSSDLPRPEPSQGLRWMLQREASVHQSALSAPQESQVQFPPPGQISVEELLERKAEPQEEEWFLEGAIELRPLSNIGPLDPLWAFAFNCEGEVVGRWRGRAAFEVVS